MILICSYFTGFVSAVEHLNKFPQDLFAELCQDVLGFLQYSRGLVSAPTFVQVCSEYKHKLNQASGVQ